MMIGGASITSCDLQLDSQASPLVPENISISCRNLSKQYRLFDSPEQRFKEALHPFKKKYHKEFLALKEVSFDIAKGATVGIIGRNGSGKSTLLQIICGVLKPTSGSVSVSGRISALLELGAGFNPDMTGRQNVVLSGIVQGFSKEEMNDRLLQIREFADIGEFFDQPVKIYSSGMFVRLAFSAAINVDPEILIVDEALAVGDVKFQNKCYNKFIEFQKAGKTILFVTHDMNAIARHCDHAILLERGSVLESGKPIDVVNRYFEITHAGSFTENLEGISDEPMRNKSLSRADIPRDTGLDRFMEEIPSGDRCINRGSYNKNEYRFGNRRAELIDYLVANKETLDPLEIGIGETVDLHIKAIFHDDVEFPVIGCGIKTFDGLLVYATNTRLMKVACLPVSRSEVLIVKFSFALNLKPGDYFISMGITERNDVISAPIRDMLDIRNDVIHFVVSGECSFDGLVGLNTTFSEISRRSKL